MKGSYFGFGGPQQLVEMHVLLHLLDSWLKCDIDKCQS